MKYAQYQAFITCETINQFILEDSSWTWRELGILHDIHKKAERYSELLVSLTGVGVFYQSSNQKAVYSKEQDIKSAAASSQYNFVNQNLGNGFLITTI